MKKTILLSSIFAVSAAVAGDVTSGNAIGALEVTMSNSTTRKLIAVPFPGYEGGETEIAVKDIVKTGNLADDSMLYVPNGTAGGYDVLKLTGGEWVPDKKVTISATGLVTEGSSLSASDVKIKRGDAFWLEPKFKAEATNGSVFLLGEGATTAGTTQASAGWNLIGNASVNPVNLKDLQADTGDQIVVQIEGGALRYYAYKQGKGWRYTQDGKWTSDNVTIQPGLGLWYKPNTARTINWDNIQAANN